MKNENTMFSNEFLRRLLDIEKLKYCYECGICTASCPIAELVPKHYNPRSLLEKLFLDFNRVLREDELWLCAWCYRCHKKCPQGLKLPEIFLAIRKIAAEKGYLQGFKQALEIIQREIPLPAVCCWICFHPERAQVDRSTIDSALKSLFVSYGLKRKESFVPKMHIEKVAIVGSGPAGLTAAYELVKKGYSVTIFESSHEPGGMLRKCIPEYRLPKRVLNAEIEHIKNLGVEIRTNVRIGKDLTINKLLQNGYKAIFIATGAHKSRKLGVEGEGLKGVFDALDFLMEINLGKKLKLGNRVAVIGGGNVAIDASRTALQLGAKEVCILYRRSKEEMPANPWEIKEAENDGVEFQCLVAPKKIIGKDGRAVAIECIRMKLGEPDASGRKRPIPIEGSEFMTEWNTIILAIGETPDLSFLPKEIEVNERKAIAVDPFTTETSLPGVFAGGDAVTGPATVIEAIVAGKRASVSIDHYLKSESLSGEEIPQVMEVQKK